MLRDAVDDLASCVDQPLSCRNTLPDVLNWVAITGPNRRTLDLLAQGLKAGVDGCSGGGGTNPFCQYAPKAVYAMRLQAAINPDAAVVYWLQYLDALLGSDYDSVTNDQKGVDGVFAFIIDGIVENIPRLVNVDNKTRATLYLKTLGDLTTLPDTAQRARVALTQIAAQQPSTPAPVPTPVPRARNIALLTIAGLATAGVITYAVWRYGRRTSRYMLTTD